MTPEDRRVLEGAIDAIERELLVIAKEKEECNDGSHVDSDCGFELLHRIRAKVSPA